MVKLLWPQAKNSKITSPQAKTVNLPRRRRERKIIRPKGENVKQMVKLPLYSLKYHQPASQMSKCRSTLRKSKMSNRDVAKNRKFQNFKNRFFCRKAKNSKMSIFDPKWVVFRPSPDRPWSGMPNQPPNTGQNQGRCPTGPPKPKKSPNMVSKGSFFGSF